MNSSQVAQKISLSLNKIFFGSGVASDSDFNSQYVTIYMSYAFNLVLVLVIVAAICTMLGSYDPLHAPFAISNIGTPLAVSNLITFVSMYFASLGWTLNDKSIRHLQGYYRFKWVHNFLVLPVFAFAIFLTGAAFRTPHYAVLALNGLISSLLLLVLLQRRIIKNTPEN